jgi:hypothetical protein
MKPQQTRLEIITEFYAAPPETLFPQSTLCAVLNCSTALAERHRWAGRGVPYIKIGRNVRYRKIAILNWLETQKTCQGDSHEA